MFQQFSESNLLENFETTGCILPVVPDMSETIVIERMNAHVELQTEPWRVVVWRSIGSACEYGFGLISLVLGLSILAALPIAIGLGEGSELRRPLGIALIGGLLISQSLTLLSTPALYVVFSCLAERRRAHSASRRLLKAARRQQKLARA